MKKFNNISRLMALLILVLSSQLFHHSTARASGISIDAGLTPAANRWILRSQVRIINRDNNLQMPTMAMKAHMFPVMVAYGLRSDAMIMVRLPYMQRETTMMNNTTTNSGFGDLFILTKYRLMRINTPAYTFGIAPTLGLELPTGKSSFTSDSYDLHVGVFSSGRISMWRMDLNLKYIWNGMASANDSNIDPGDEIGVQAAISRQFSVGKNADIAVAPVLESSYQKLSADKNNGATISNSGESLFLLAPGLKFTIGSFILEGLVQFPVWQKQEGSQTERSTSLLMGFRLMN